MMTDRDLLIRCGRLLHGERWQSPLARDLGVAIRTVQRWAADQEIPAGIWSDIDALLIARGIEISMLRCRLPAGTGATPVVV